MSEGRYSVAQICVNGHSVNAFSDRYPQHNEEFCQQCGSQTITACEKCNTPIRGKFIAPGSFSSSLYVAPKFCLNCGHAYPWTQARIRAASELADLIEEFNETERQQLKESIQNIVQDTPETLIAAFKFRALMEKAGPVMKAALWETIAGVADKKAEKLIVS